MQDYRTIMSVIQMRLCGCSYDVVQRRNRIGSSTLQLIMKRFEENQRTYEELQKLSPEEVMKLFYPPENTKRRRIEPPDFQHYYDRIHAEGSKVNISYCWIEYKRENPDGYQKSQFYEYYDRFVEEHYGGRRSTMAVERVPGEKMYIDWVGDRPELLTDPETGEVQKIHLFATTLGVSSMIYAEAFLDEKLPHFIEGIVNAVNAYGCIAKYFVPDNLKTAVSKHTRDELILQSVCSDLEDFYGTIILPPPPRKPKGKATIENHVRFLETHLVEKLKERVYVSLEELNADIKKIVATLNSRNSAIIGGSRKAAFEKYDKPCMTPLPGGEYEICDYKPFTKVPDNYHLEYDGHYYSVFYTYRGQPAILKATVREIRICDRYNRFICKHDRAYKEFPRYITEAEHMKPEHLYYKEVNAKDGAYYRRWAAVIGPFMSELIDRVLQSSKHEEQAYNACAGILHAVKDMPHGIAEEIARTCVAMNSCRYSSFKRVLSHHNGHSQQAKEGAEKLPCHENIRGKDHYQ